MYLANQGGNTCRGKGHTTPMVVDDGALKMMFKLLFQGVEAILTRTSLPAGSTLSKSFCMWNQLELCALWSNPAVHWHTSEYINMGHMLGSMQLNFHQVHPRRLLFTRFSKKQINWAGLKDLSVADKSPPPPCKNPKVPVWCPFQHSSLWKATDSCHKTVYTHIV